MPAWRRHNPSVIQHRRVSVPFLGPTIPASVFRDHLFISSSWCSIISGVVNARNGISLSGVSKGDVEVSRRGRTFQVDKSPLQRSHQSESTSNVIFVPHLAELSHPFFDVNPGQRVCRRLLGEEKSPQPELGVIYATLIDSLFALHHLRFLVSPSPYRRETD